MDQIKSLCTWDAIFKHSVEGRPSDFSLRIEDERFVWDASKAITTKTGPNPELILHLLRSSEPIPQNIRDWIADLLDPEADTNFCYKKFGRRRSGGKPKWNLWNIPAALQIEERISLGDGYESAIESAIEKFGIARTAAARAYSYLKNARREEQ